MTYLSSPDIKTVLKWTGIEAKRLKSRERTIPLPFARYLIIDFLLSVGYRDTDACRAVGRDRSMYLYAQKTLAIIQKNMRAEEEVVFNRFRKNMDRWLDETSDEIFLISTETINGVTNGITSR